MSEPPAIRNTKRKSRARLSNNERREINEHGLVVPYSDPKNYEPNLNNNALLWSSGTLQPKFNYRNKAKANQKSAWNEYLRLRAKAEANKAKNTRNKGNKGNKNNKGNTRKNNGTRVINQGLNTSDPRIKLGF
jgi:hypothetical protein